MTMKKLYAKNELSFALTWIGIYCALQSVANPLNAVVGIAYSASAVFCIAQALILFCFIQRNGLLERCGLCPSPVPARRFLYYIPLLLLSTTNLWNGAARNLNPTDTLFAVACMLCVGFLEEVLFRGFLFNALAKENVKTAILLSSVSFGLGHLLNLVNGSGAGLLETLFQVVAAVLLGFLFVLLFHRGRSLWPCIIAHSAINVASIFSNGDGLTPGMRALFRLLLIAIVAAYAVALTKTLPPRQDCNAPGGMD